jgi:hypothetical protein
MIRATFDVESLADFLLLQESAKGVGKCILRKIDTCVSLKSNVQCVAMNCVGVLNPPISYTPVTETVPYYILILQCQPTDGGAVVLIPYVTLTQPQHQPQPQAPLGGSPRAEVQFQTVGVNPPYMDQSPNLLYYQTMTITQDTPGFTIFRHRLRNPGPSPYALAGPDEWDATELTVDTDVIVYQALLPIPPIQDVVFPIRYVHRTINDTSEPLRELYLQQPF